MRPELEKSVGTGARAAPGRAAGSSTAPNEGLPVHPHHFQRFGSTPGADGTTFALPSAHAERLVLELYDDAFSATPSRVVPLDPAVHRFGHVWSVNVPHVGPGQLYGWRAEGQWAPEAGLRFNHSKLLLDPWARAFAGSLDTSHPSVRGQTPSGKRSTLDSAAHVWKSVVVADAPFDPGRRPAFSDVPLILELHVGNHTRSPSSGVSAPGTYRGVIETLPRLRRLGVTALELLPVQAFNPREDVGANPATGERLRNVWGYNTLGFFAPHAGYASDPSDPLAPARELRELVRACHDEGIQVILDVVYNHTAEGDERGPTVSFRGLDNPTWYLQEGGRYRNASGCGNTLRCGHPIVADFIVESLRYWVTDFGIDGFRFDLAPILGRNARGDWVPEGNLLDRIAGDPVLAHTLLISESWDAEGLYVVGDLHPRYLEWNDRYRDDARRFVRADPGLARDLGRRLGGSPDLFARRKTDARASVNFVSCHDGFTLRDLVSYDVKHNAANGEDGRDGSNHNHSDNCGVEGETHDPRIVALRRQQARNFLVGLFVARGTPMLLHGDERWRTQGGNNNTWCQDGPVSWVDWHDDELVAFVEGLAAFRRRHPALARSAFSDAFDGGERAAHGVRLGEPDRSNTARTLLVHDTVARVVVVFNAWRSALEFQLPPGSWRRVIDTVDAAVVKEASARLQSGTLVVGAFSTVVLVEERA